MPWLREVYCLDSSAGSFLSSNSVELRKNVYDYQRQRLSYFLHEIYGRYLIKRLFLIVGQFPTSRPIVRDLAVCIEHTNLMNVLIVDFRKDLQKRLLHPGKGLMIIKKDVLC